MFFWNSLAFLMIRQMLAIWSLSQFLISISSAFSKTSLNIRNFTVHVLLKSGLENFKHYFTSVWDECNCVVVWEFFGIAFLWDWNENWPFPVLWPPLSFPNLLAYWVQHFMGTLRNHKEWESAVFKSPKWCRNRTGKNDRQPEDTFLSRKSEPCIWSQAQQESSRW